MMSAFSKSTTNPIDCTNMLVAPRLKGLRDTLLCLLSNLMLLDEKNEMEIKCINLQLADAERGSV